MQVRLRCSKIANKLRVRIISPGYNHESNCQFPTAIRKNGQEYMVPSTDISFCERSNQKFFYRIGKKNISVVDSNLFPIENSIEKVYGDDDTDTECCICLTEEKDVVFAPCGHYTCCNTCSIKIKECPICRAYIGQIVKRDQIE